jgi:hypothetical protein
MKKLWNKTEKGYDQGGIKIIMCITPREWKKMNADVSERSSLRNERK